MPASEKMLSQAIAFNPVLSSQGAFPTEDGKVRIALDLGPQVQSARLELFFDVSFPLTKENGLWGGILDLPAGFNYATLVVDGAEVLTPWLPIGFGCSRPINFIEAPAKDSDFYQVRDVPHGSIVREYYPSGVTSTLESCLVYLPPAYQPEQAYPILYLQHGHGENETGWLHQGRMNFILDNLIAEGKATPMLVVMCNGMVQINGEHDTSAFPQVLVQDVIPFIEGKYKVIGDKAHRAMAGLSMGSIHTSVATLTHPELFAYAGLFSGFLQDHRAERQAHLEPLEDPQYIEKNYRVFFRAMGDQDTWFSRFLEEDQLLEGKQVTGVTRRVYPGPHDWNVWRHCFHDYVQLLFR